MRNEYEIRGDVTVIFLKSKKYGKMETLISTDKLQKANEFSGTWYALYENRIKSYYVRGSITMPNGQQAQTSLHRWITNCPLNLVCDHINHDTLDNTDENLRILTDGENRQNRKGLQRNNTSGIRGVCWNKSKNKWRSKVGIKHIGYFDNLEDARIAAETARAKMMPYSKEAYLNAN